VLAESGINERQKRAVRFVKEKGSINNSEYQVLVDASMRNATRNLKDLADKGIFVKRGIHGKGVHYVLSKSAGKAPITPRLFPF